MRVGKRRRRIIPRGNTRDQLCVSPRPRLFGSIPDGSITFPRHGRRPESTHRRYGRPVQPPNFSGQRLATAVGQRQRAAV